MKYNYTPLLDAIKHRGASNLAAITAFHSCKAGERGAFGTGPDSFLHRRDSGKPNRHRRYRQPVGYATAPRDRRHDHTLIRSARVSTLGTTAPTAAQTASV